MIRHIFIGTFKDDVEDDIKRRQIDDMQAMKEHIPGIINLQVGLSTGWVGQTNQVAMTVDFRTKEAFDTYMTHPYHTEYIDKETATAYFDRSTFIAAQFEYNKIDNQ